MDKRSKMGKRGVKQSEEWEGRLADGKVVDVALREMKLAVPKIERRVMERETLTAEWRFKVPKARDLSVEKDDG